MLSDSEPNEVVTVISINGDNVRVQNSDGEERDMKKSNLEQNKTLKLILNVFSIISNGNFIPLETYVLHHWPPQTTLRPTELRPVVLSGDSNKP